MKKVITYGTFDLFHVGHLNLLRRAKALGDYLIVAVSSDAFNASKGKKAYHSIEDRVKILEAIEYVDEVILEESWNQKIDDILSNNVDIFVMGDDWKGEFDFLKDYCYVVYVPTTEGISILNTLPSTTMFVEVISESSSPVTRIALFTTVPSVFPT